MKGRSSWISTSAASGFRGQCRQAWPSATPEPYTSQKVSQTAWRGSSLDLSFRGQRRQAWPSATPEPYTSSKASQTALRGSSLDPSFRGQCRQAWPSATPEPFTPSAASAVRPGRAPRVNLRHRVGQTGPKRPNMVGLVCMLPEPPEGPPPCFSKGVSRL